MGRGKRMTFQRHRGPGIRWTNQQRPGLTVFQVGPSKVSGFIRPTVKLVDGAVRSVSLDADSPSSDLSFETLKAANTDPETGLVADIKAIAERKLDGAKQLSAMPKPADKETADLVVDALAPSWAVIRTLDSLRATGFAHFRFLRTAVHGQGLPLVVRAPEKELVERLNVGYERPAIAHVTSKHVDIWLPNKVTTGQVPTKVKAKMPKKVEAGYRGKTLVRLRVNIPQAMGHGLDDATLTQVQDATSYAFAKTGAGRLLHVIASEDALAADVLRVARIFQEAAGSRLTGDNAIWPDSACAETGIANSGKSKCPTGVAVAFSKEAVPSSRGITSEPAEPKKRESKKPEPPKPAKKTAFCDRKSISAKMRRRTAAFRFCYEKALRMQKGLAGRVKVRFTIGASGALVGSPSVVSATLKNASVHKCLVKNVSRVKFDPPKGEPAP